MNFHRSFGNADVAGNLLVQPALYDLNQNRALGFLFGLALLSERGHIMCAVGRAAGAYRAGLAGVWSVDRAVLDRDYSRTTVVTAHSGAREKVVVARALAESVKVNLSRAIARK
jgi:hypothetical protein